MVGFNLERRNSSFCSECNMAAGGNSPEALLNKSKGEAIL